MEVTQSKPAVRTPTPCGRDGALAIGREPSQLGWYEFVARRHKQEIVIDVGCGLGCGVALMNHWGCHACGFEIDERLSDRPWTHIEGRPHEVLRQQPAVYTAIDVIEHVVDDLAFLNGLRERATKAVYVSTPNGAVSQCRNEHHAREYTIPEFVEIFQPDEVWGSLNGGWVGREQIVGPGFSKLAGRGLCDEWPHFCAVFYVKKGD